MCPVHQQPLHGAESMEKYDIPPPENMDEDDKKIEQADMKEEQADDKNYMHNFRTTKSVRKSASCSTSG